MAALQCVILVRGITRDGAKSMMSVGGGPLLYQLIDNAARFGFRRFLLLAGPLFEVMRAEFPHGVFRTPGGVVEVEALGEPKPLGAGGALRSAAEKLAPEFLMLDAGSLFDFNWLALTEPLSGAVGRLALRRVEDASRHVVVSRDGFRATALETAEAPGPGEISGGVYWLSREILGLIPETGAVSLEREILPRAVAQGRLQARLESGGFIDASEPERAHAFRRGGVFFDRDGVLNIDEGYTHAIDTFRWSPGAREAIRLVNERGLYVFVVTNQSGVARGLYTEEDVRRLHAHMQAELRGIGAHIDDFRYCPHHENAEIAAYRRVCDWRKPRPGMIRDLLAYWPVDLASSLLIGDKESDIAAAEAAGLTGFLTDGATPLDDFVARALKWK